MLNAFQRWRDISDSWSFADHKKKAWDHYCEIRDSLKLEPLRLKTEKIEPVRSTVSEVFSDDDFRALTIDPDLH